MALTKQDKHYLKDNYVPRNEMVNEMVSVIEYIEGKFATKKDLFATKEDLQKEIKRLDKKMDKRFDQQDKILKKILRRMDAHEEWMKQHTLQINTNTIRLNQLENSVLSANN